jgi:hypothetical protein
MRLLTLTTIISATGFTGSLACQTLGFNKAQTAQNSRLDRLVRHLGRKL